VVNRLRPTTEEIGAMGREIESRQGLCRVVCSFFNLKNLIELPWQRGLVVSSPPDTEEIGAMGREIESRQDIDGW
jgi:hypothetical protein